MPVRPSIIIIGAGFAGLQAARALRHTDADILVIDRKNHHTFQPLLYQVASAALSPADVAAPVRKILTRHRNCRVLMGRVTEIDTVNRTVHTGGRTFSYDYLILATGATHSYFGQEHWARHAPGLKTIEDSLEIRRRILNAFEIAENAADEHERRAALTFAIVGAGPTGVEMAGALSEIALKVVRRDYRSVDTADARVVLLEALDRVLPAFDEDCSASAKRQLETLGVEIRLGRMVTDIDEHGLTLGEGDDAERIPARTVIWSAGVQASPLGRMLGAETDKKGRVKVEPELSVPGLPEVFVTGDLALARNPDGSEVPGVAPAAMQMGAHAGRTVARLVTNQAEARRPFRYRDRGLLATIGRHRATGTVFGRRVHGFPAWALWAWVHLFFLVGFRNRLVVMVQWAWNYLIHERGARLITEPEAGAR